MDSQDLGVNHFVNVNPNIIEKLGELGIQIGKFLARTPLLMASRVSLVLRWDCLSPRLSLVADKQIRHKIYPYQNMWWLVLVSLIIEWKTVCHSRYHIVVS